MSADDVNLWANWVLIASLVVGVIATWAIVVTGNIKETALKKELSQARERTETLRNNNLQLQKEVEDERLARLKIEEKLAPRSLTSEQLITIAEKVKKYAPQPFQFVSYQDDAEVRGILLHIGKALLTSGWKGLPPNGFLAFDLEFGITIDLTTENASKFKEAADALAAALNEERIMAVVRINPKITDKLDHISIRVGKKP